MSDQGTDKDWQRQQVVGRHPDQAQPSLGEQNRKDVGEQNHDHQAIARDERVPQAIKQDQDHQHPDHNQLNKTACQIA